MKAIEFTANTKDGSIQIPKEHLKNLKSDFRVIILVEDSNKSKKKTKMKSLDVDLVGFEFDRDESHER